MAHRKAVFHVINGWKRGVIPGSKCRGGIGVKPCWKGGGGLCSSQARGQHGPWTEEGLRTGCGLCFG